MKRIRILAIAPQPFYTPRGTPLSVYYRTLVMAEKGASIDLLTYGQGDDVTLPEAEAEAGAGVRIIRIPGFFMKRVKIGPSITKAFLDAFMILYTIALLVRRRYDVVHAHEESVFWCRFLKPIFRFRLIYDMHSSLPQQLTNFKFTTSRLLIGAFDRLERTCLRSADAVITICPDLKDYALSHDVEPERHFLIENSIFDDVRVKDRAACSRDAKRSAAADVPPKHQDGRRIVYAGTFEPYQGIDLLLEAFARAAQKQPDVELLLIGGSPEQVTRMKEFAQRLNITDRCIFTGQLPKSIAMEHSRSADVLVSPRVSGTNTPLKVYEQLASGIPLVATRIWSHTQVLTDDVCVLVEPNADAMAEGLIAALTDEQRRASIVQAARELYERDYSRQVYEANIDAVLNRVTAIHHGGPRRATEKGEEVLLSHERAI